MSPATPPSMSLAIVPQPVSPTGYLGTWYTLTSDPEFMRVGHSLCDLFIAWLGGLIGLFAYWRYRGREGQP